MVLLFSPAVVSVSSPTTRENSESLPSKSGRETRSSVAPFFPSSCVVLSFSSPRPPLHPASSVHCLPAFSCPPVLVSSRRFPQLSPFRFRNRGGSGLSAHSLPPAAYPR